MAYFLFAGSTSRFPVSNLALRPKEGGTDVKTDGRTDGHMDKFTKFIANSTGKISGIHRG